MKARNWTHIMHHIWSMTNGTALRRSSCYVKISWQSALCLYTLIRSTFCTPCEYFNGILHHWRSDVTCIDDKYIFHFHVFTVYGNWAYFLLNGLHKCVYVRNPQVMAIYMQSIMFSLYTSSSVIFYNQWHTTWLYIKTCESERWICSIV